MKTVPAKNLICTIAGNVNNTMLSDADFREFIRNSVAICNEVIEWREAMVKLAEDHRDYAGKICPEIIGKRQFAQEYECSFVSTPLTPERKAELKGTVFEHCESEEEVQARLGFDAMS